MGNFFGIRRRAPLVTAQDRAILQLKQQRDKIKIYQKKTEKDIEKNKEMAIQLFRNGFKDRALVVLRRKKCMEEIVARTDQQLDTLEQLVNDIEYTQIEVSVVEGLKVGTEALKQLNSLMNIDDIQQLMEDNEEAAEKQREITDILARSAVRFDEDDLMKELDKYAAAEKQVEEEKEAKEAAEVPEVPQIPEEKVDVQELPEVPQEMPKEDIIELLPEVPESDPVTPKKNSSPKRQLEPAQ